MTFSSRKKSDLHEKGKAFVHFWTLKWKKFCKFLDLKMEMREKENFKKV